MGKIKRGILGGFSGKVANVVGGSWKGIAYMRAQPLSVSNPQTAGQVAQRTSFSFAVLIAQLILSGVIKPLWDRFAQGMSGYNAFVSANVEHMIDWTTTTWADVVTSLGKMLPTTAVLGLASNGDPDVTITWDQTLVDNFQQLTDKVYLVVVNETQEKVAFTSGTATRDDETDTVTFADNVLSGDKLHVYLAFQRADGSIVSDSDYLLVNVG